MMYQTALAFVRRAASDLKLDDVVTQRLLDNDQEHQFELVIGDKVHQAYRIQHSNKRGPYKGGIRFAGNVNIDEVKALAMLMSIKTAAVNIPLGGGKGGVAFDPRNHDVSHVEAVARAYVQALHPHIGPDKDVPAPDMNTNAQVIDWMVDEFEQVTGDTSKASFTGKSLGNGGSEGREAATGHGGVITLREYLKHTDHDEPLTVAVQGAGNVAFYFAKIAQAELTNVRIVAISNSRQTLHAKNEEQLDFTDVNYDANSTTILERLAGEHTESLDRDAVLGLDVDILVLAALEDVINESNQADIKASIVVELANGPINEAAFRTLEARGVRVLPDVIANAGGVIVSYLEWQQNKAGESWDEDRVNDELDRILSHATNDMLELAKKEGLTYKDAAFRLAVKRLTGEDI